MATNLGIDEHLLSEALKLSGKKTKREAVNLALEEFISRRKQLNVLKLFGTIDFDQNYDYKKERSRKG
jgi:Arc/MetJ family transcription regulator